VTVLDASALLAYLLDEPGAGIVEHAIDEEASIGAVNLAEVLAKLVDGGIEVEDAAETIGVLPITVLPFDHDLAIGSARLRETTARAGLSLGDRSCLALAMALGERVLTADAAWVGVGVGVEVVVIR
jgi:ribonuclease VapC